MYYGISLILISLLITVQLLSLKGLEKDNLYPILE